MSRHLALSALVVVSGICSYCSPVTPQTGDPKQPKVELKQLLSDLKSKDEHVKVNALMALADFGPKAEPAIPDLIAALQANNEDFRLNSAIALGKIGKAAVPELAKLLGNKDEDTRYYAI